MGTMMGVIVHLQEPFQAKDQKKIEGMAVAAFSLLPLIIGG